MDLLPPEILANIANHLADDRKSLKCLRLSCKQLERGVTPTLFQKVVIWLYPASYQLLVKSSEIAGCCD